MGNVTRQLLNADVPALRDSVQLIELEVYEFTERLYCDDNGNVFGHGDYRGKHLLGHPGVLISSAYAATIGVLAYDANPPLVLAEPPREPFPEESAAEAAAAGGER